LNGSAETETLLQTTNPHGKGTARTTSKI